jgi:hypothetical protein
LRALGAYDLRRAVSARRERWIKVIPCHFAVV